MFHSGTWVLDILNFQYFYYKQFPCLVAIFGLVKNSIYYNIVCDMKTNQWETRRLRGRGRRSGIGRLGLGRGRLGSRRGRLSRRRGRLRTQRKFISFNLLFKCICSISLFNLAGRGLKKYKYILLLPTRVSYYLKLHRET